MKSGSLSHIVNNHKYIELYDMPAGIAHYAFAVHDRHHIGIALIRVKMYADSVSRLLARYCDDCVALLSLALSEPLALA